MTHDKLVETGRYAARLLADAGWTQKEVEKHLGFGMTAISTLMVKGKMSEDRINKLIQLAEDVADGKVNKKGAVAVQVAKPVTPVARPTGSMLDRLEEIAKLLTAADNAAIAAADSADPLLTPGLHKMASEIRALRDRYLGRYV